MNKGILLFWISFIFIACTIAYMHQNKVPIDKNDYSNNVGIITAWGCIKTLDSPKVFETRSNLYDRLFGYHFVRCS